jgi:hypothetical protein
MTKNELYKRDYRDICYFVDHVKNIDFRISLLKELGYRIGVDAATSNSKLKKVIIGKRKERRIQVTDRTKKSPFVQCVILE